MPKRRAINIFECFRESILRCKINCKYRAQIKKDVSIERRRRKRTLNPPTVFLFSCLTPRDDGVATGDESQAECLLDISVVVNDVTTN